MANKRRCTACRGYFAPDEMYRSGVSGVCSRDCLIDLQNKYRAKRARRQSHRENKHRFGRRLPGKIRDEVRGRDGACCRYCGSGLGRIEIHHVEYRSQGGPDHAHNLITLCQEHHLMIHSNKKKWQPLCKLTLWCHYAEERFVTIPEVERAFGNPTDANWGEDDVDEDDDTDD